MSLMFFMVIFFTFFSGQKMGGNNFYSVFDLWGRGRMMNGFRRWLDDEGFGFCCFSIFCGAVVLFCAGLDGSEGA